jgi:hypothetical protein
MPRYALALAIALALVACQKKNDGATAHPLSEEQIKDGEATVRVDVSYRSVSKNEIELVVDLVAVGIEQMDKIVVDVAPDGFVVVEGVAEWSGFVPPYERHKHKVTLQPRDDAADATATVSVRRSLDSELLWQREFPFQVGSGGIAPLAP